MYQAMEATTTTTTEEPGLSPILDQEDEEDDEDFKTCSSSSRSERTSYSNINNSSSSSSSLFSEYFESEEEEEEEEECNIVPLSLPTMVERENRKNIVKTLQGQADIITNWSLTTRESDGRSVWTLLDGKPYTVASKFHVNVVPTTRSTTFGGSSSNSSSMSLSNNMQLGCSALSRRLEAFVDLPNEINNEINNLSRISSFSSSLSASSSSASSSVAASFNISYVTDEESKSLFDESTSSTAAPGRAVEEDTSGIGSSMKEDGGNKGRLYPCQKCDTLLTTKHYWYKHRIMDHGREERARNADVLYDCRLCPKQFGQKKSRDAHVKTHAFRNSQQQQETPESSSSPSESSSALMNQVTPV